MCTLKRWMDKGGYDVQMKGGWKVALCENLKGGWIRVGIMWKSKTG